jgi:hypothetical protein
MKTSSQEIDGSITSLSCLGGGLIEFTRTIVLSDGAIKTTVRQIMPIADMRGILWQDGGMLLVFEGVSWAVTCDESAVPELLALWRSARAPVERVARVVIEGLSDAAAVALSALTGRAIADELAGRAIADLEAEAADEAAADEAAAEAAAEAERPSWIVYLRWGGVVDVAGQPQGGARAREAFQWALDAMGAARVAVKPIMIDSEYLGLEVARIDAEDAKIIGAGLGIVLV